MVRSRLGVTQDGIETPDRLLEDVDASLKDVKNPLLNSALDPEVEHLDGIRLADAVYATDPLLYAHRVPREVVVHKQMAELEVAPLAARFGAEQDARLLRCPETFHGSVFGGRLHLAVEELNIPADGFEPMPQVFLRLAELSEEQHLRRGIVLLKLLKLCHKRVGFGVGRNGVKHLDQPLQLCGFLGVSYRDFAQQRTDEFVLYQPFLEVGDGRLRPLVQPGGRRTTLEPFPAPVERHAKRLDTARHEFLEDNHDEADRLIVRTVGPGVPVSNEHLYCLEGASFRRRKAHFPAMGLPRHESADDLLPVADQHLGQQMPGRQVRADTCNGIRASV